MPKLTDTQLVILSAAAQRDGGGLLPPPKRLKMNAGALTGVLKSLLRKGLATERPAPPDAPAWRETGHGQRILLIVSPAGFAAIGIEPQDATSSTSSKPNAGRTGRKRAKGATLPDLQKATGWQPHSVRAALTGLRKKGHEIVRTKTDGRATRYRISEIRSAG